MKRKIAAVAGALGVIALASGSQAATPAHPSYLHALHDLKLAYAAVASRGGDAVLTTHEKSAMEHIHAAGDLIRQVAPQEGKPVSYSPKVTLDPAKAGALHDAEDYLKRAYSDVVKPESDPKDLAIQKQVLHEIGYAGEEVHAAIHAFDLHQ